MIVIQTDSSALFRLKKSLSIHQEETGRINICLYVTNLGSNYRMKDWQYYSYIPIKAVYTTVSYLLGEREKNLYMCDHTWAYKRYTLILTVTKFSKFGGKETERKTWESYFLIHMFPFMILSYCHYSWPSVVSLKVSSCTPSWVSHISCVIVRPFLQLLLGKVRDGHVPLQTLAANRMEHKVGISSAPLNFSPSVCEGEEPLAHDLCGFWEWN